MENPAIEPEQKISYDSLVKAIVRPPRDLYIDEEMGAPLFKIKNRTFIRKDYEIIDFQGFLLKLSFIEPDIKERPSEIMPCVIYLHANASSRLEGINIRKFLLKRDINLCVFDFEGSGNSEGDYISLGYHEKNQVRNVVNFVEKYPGVGKIGLWGRSMGAATALIYASIDKRIETIVVDSPFSDFRRLAKEMCLSQIKLPGFLIEGAISIIGRGAMKKNGMKVSEIKPIDAVKNCYIPIIFIHAHDDDLVPYHHSVDLMKNYAGKIKELKTASGGHNAKRPNIMQEQIGEFFSRYLSNKFEKKEEEKNNINNTWIDFSLKAKRQTTIYDDLSLPNKANNFGNNYRMSKTDNDMLENTNINKGWLKELEKETKEYSQIPDSNSTKKATIYDDLHIRQNIDKLNLSNKKEIIEVKINNENVKNKVEDGKKNE